MATTDTSLTKKSVSANVMSRFQDAVEMMFTTLIFASVFVPHKIVALTNSGALKFANVSANPKSALRIFTGKLTWKSHQTVAASANNTHVN